jgi:hypothetical protein
VLPIFLKVGYMVVISGLGGLLGWEQCPLFGRFGCVEMIVFTDKNCAFLQVITFSADGASRLIYGGLYTVGGYGDGYFFLYMGGA